MTIEPDGLDEAAGEAESVVAETVVGLPSGESLSPEEVDELLRLRPATLIAIVGSQSSGKTTLISAIYDRFLRGPFGSHLFVGSRSLIGFERLMHFARAESGVARPDTVRTSIGDGLRCFHLAIARSERAEHRDLLLTDRAGEYYEEARSDSSKVLALVEVHKAGTVVILLDGGRVAKPSERSGAVQFVRSVIRAFIDNGALTSSSRVQVVTTKWDLVARAASTDDTSTYLADFKERLRRDVGGSLGELSFKDIAARDPEGVFEPAHGIAALLEDWSDSRQPVIPGFVPAGDSSSEQDRLLSRTALGRYP